MESLFFKEGGFFVVLGVGVDFSVTLSEGDGDGWVEKAAVGAR